MLKEYQYSYWQLELYKKITVKNSNLTPSQVAKLLAVGAFIERCDLRIESVNVRNDNSKQLIYVVIECELN